MELGTAGITSPGDFVESGFDPVTAGKLDQAFAEHNPEVIWTDNLHQGFVRLVLTPSAGHASFIAVNTITSPVYRTHTIGEWNLRKIVDELALEKI